MLGIVFIYAYVYTSMTRGLKVIIKDLTCGVESWKIELFMYSKTILISAVSLLH